MDNPKQWQKHRFEENVKDWKKQRQQRVDMFVKDIIDIIQQKDEEWCGLEQGWLDALKEVVGSERAEEVAAKLEDARILDIGEQIAKYFSPTQRADSPPLSPLQRDGINDFLNSSPILGHETITALPNNDTTSDRTLSITESVPARQPHLDPSPGQRPTKVLTPICSAMKQAEKNALRTDLRGPPDMRPNKNKTRGRSTTVLHT